MSAVTPFTDPFHSPFPGEGPHAPPSHAMEAGLRLVDDFFVVPFGRFFGDFGNGLVSNGRVIFGGGGGFAPPVDDGGPEVFQPEPEGDDGLEVFLFEPVEDDGVEVSPFEPAEDDGVEVFPHEPFDTPAPEPWLPTLAPGFSPAWIDAGLGQQVAAILPAMDLWGGQDRIDWAWRPQSEHFDFFLY